MLTYLMPMMCGLSHSVENCFCNLMRMFSHTPVLSHSVDYSYRQVTDMEKRISSQGNREPGSVTKHII